LGVVCFGTRGKIEDSKNKPTKKSVQIFVGGGVVECLIINLMFIFFSKLASVEMNTLSNL
jgi:hypothetical protein